MIELKKQVFPKFLSPKIINFTDLF